MSIPSMYFEVNPVPVPTIEKAVYNGSTCVATFRILIL